MQIHADGSAPASEWPPSPEAIALSAVAARRLKEDGLAWRLGDSLRKSFASEGSRPSPRESGATLGGAIACGLGSAPSLGRERARLRVGHKNPERQGRNSALRRTGNEKRRRFRCLAPDGRGTRYSGRIARNLA